jgi:DNA primase
MREADLVQPPKEEIPEYKINWPEYKLPSGSKPLDQWEYNPLYNKALEYISYRGLLELGDWYYSNAIIGQMQHRIILPYKYKNKIVGFTARWTGEEQHKYPKYYQQQPRDFVFNLDAQKKERKYVLVTEGPFDAVAIDGVAIGGSNINYQQAQIINQLGKEVIFVPDQDKAGIDVVRQATYYNWSVSFPPWDEVKDCAEAVNKYGRPFTLKSILSFVETNKTKIKVKSQLWK